MLIEVACAVDGCCSSKELWLARPLSFLLMDSTICNYYCYELLLLRWLGACKCSDTLGMRYIPLAPEDLFNDCMQQKPPWLHAEDYWCMLPSASIF